MTPASRFPPRLLRLPYGRWVPVTAAAGHLGLPPGALRPVLRAGRRSGALRVLDGGQGVTHVMRVRQNPNSEEI